LIEAQDHAETNEAYQTYLTYIAMKAHFNEEDYDFFKFGCRAAATALSFRNRNDKIFFHKLSRMKNPEQRMLAQLLNNNEASIQDMVEGDKVFFAWKKRQESFFYILKKEMSLIGKWRDVLDRL